MTQEGERYRRHPSEPLYPIPLPQEMVEFLREQGPYASLMQRTDQGLAFVLKAPAQEIVRARGTVPVHVQHALYDHRLAPVIRTVLSIYDIPRHSLRFELFCNVADPAQRADFAALGEQEQLLLLFYDGQLRHRLNKVVPTKPDDTVARILAQADALRAAIPAWRLHFDKAKAAVMRGTRL